MVELQEAEKPILAIIDTMQVDVPSWVDPGEAHSLAK